MDFIKPRPHVDRDDDETRVTDPLTGGQKGTKMARFSLIPPEFLWALAEHYGKGALKYADRNWEKGYKWSLTVDALGRHLNAWLMGETNDPDTGSNHLIAVAWHACALFIYQLRGLGTDDVRIKDQPAQMTVASDFSSEASSPLPSVGQSQGPQQPFVPVQTSPPGMIQIQKARERWRQQDQEQMKDAGHPLPEGHSL